MSADLRSFALKLYFPHCSLYAERAASQSASTAFFASANVTGTIRQIRTSKPRAAHLGLRRLTIIHNYSPREPSANRGLISTLAHFPRPYPHPSPAPTYPIRTMSTYSEPTAEQAVALFQEIEKRFPHNSVGEDMWYLVTLSALVGVEPEHVGTLYTYLINKPQFKSSDSRKELVRRLREGLVKNISIQGVCKPIEAIIAIVKVESPEDQDFSFSREGWQTGPENLARGDAWLNKIYKQNLSTTTDNFSAHKDFEFISREITYGFYLSDHSILGPVETELVVLSGIMIQNLPFETAWHLRGTRRVGVSFDDVELIQQCVEMVASFSGARLHKVPRVADIEHEV